jgi:hypothetical protein
VALVDHGYVPPRLGVWRAVAFSAGGDARGDSNRCGRSTPSVVKTAPSLQERPDAATLLLSTSVSQRRLVIFFSDLRRFRPQSPRRPHAPAK